MEAKFHRPKQCDDIPANGDQYRAVATMPILFLKHISAANEWGLPLARSRNRKNSNRIDSTRVLQVA
jgi:hypothetical protein